MAAKDRVLFALLSAALKLSPFLSSRTVRRFRNSAAKRDPRQRLGKFGEHVTDSSPEFRASQQGEDFFPYAPPDRIDPKVRLIAHYLPQFHPFPENDDWWGKGFTEWTNVGKAVPNFPGHHQPHCPIHFGYYDLRVPEVMAEQAEVAKAYGVTGFSYYFYWFNGKTLMELPLQQMLHRDDIDMPFCLNWANENWTRRWDGRERDVLIGQDYSVEDSLKLLRHVRQYMEDRRYIRIDGRPVFVVYRADIVPEIRKITDAWRAEARSWGWPDLYLIAAQSFGVGNPIRMGFDAAMEFPPHQVERKDITDDLGVHNPDFCGSIFDYNVVVDAELAKAEPDYKLFRSAMLSWDNTARNQNAPKIMARFSIQAYKRWLSHLCREVLANSKYSQDEKIVFVNAWNEWAEGTHLEPDRRFGFAYLQATHEALASCET